MRLLRQQTQVPEPSAHLTPALRDDLTFAGLAALLWRNRFRIGAGFAAGAVLALAAAFTQKPVFQGKATLEVKMPNEDYLGGRQLNPAAEPGMILLEPFLQTQVRLLQSESLAGRVIAKLGLVRHPEFNRPPGLAARLRARLTGKRIGPADARSVNEEFRKNLGVRTAGQTQIVEITFDSTDPQLAAAVPNAIAEAYRTESHNQVVKSTTQTADLLEHELEELQRAAATAEQRLEEFVAQNGLSIAEDRESIAEARLRQTQSALSSAHENRLAEESHYQQLKSTPAEALARDLESETLRAYRVQLAELRRKRAELIEVLTPEHYKVRQAEAEIREVESAFERERKGILGRLRAQFDAARFREENLEKDYREQSRALSEQMSKTVAYRLLKRDVDTRRQLYEAMLEKVKEAGVVSARQASNVRIVDPALVPERPVKPNKPFYLVLGLAGGLFAGLVWAFAHERGASGQISGVVLPALDTPLIGSVPRIAGSPIAEPAKENEPVVRLRGFGGRKTIPLQPVSKRLATTAGEPFRQMLPRIFDRANPPRVVAVSSAVRGEGKTVTAANLAIALAETGRSVLLIDADRFHPELHEIFRLGTGGGFSDLIVSTGEARVTFPERSVWMTGTPGLYVLPGGHTAGRFGALAADPRVPALFNALSRDFDVILLDTPPILADPEARAIARHADALVLVVSGGSAESDSLRKALEICTTENLPVIGKILNQTGRAASALAS